MKCPRDKAAMIFADDGKRMSNSCPDCKGLLLGAEEVGRALGEGREMPMERIATLPQGALACPHDGTAMRTLVHREVEIDLCAECGALWLDAGELDKLGAGKGRKGSRKAMAAAALVAAGAGAATVAAANPVAQSSFVSSIADSVGGFAVEGVVEVAFEFAGEALGALVEGIFS
jgi:Zn-finger nucleic acid-binding protein